MKNPYPICKQEPGTSEKGMSYHAMIGLASALALSVLLFSCSFAEPQRYIYGSSIEKNFTKQVGHSPTATLQSPADTMPASLLSKIYEERYVKPMTEPLDEQQSDGMNGNNLR